jgi:hypothetical protein
MPELAPVMRKTGSLGMQASGDSGGCSELDGEPLSRDVRL